MLGKLFGGLRAVSDKAGGQEPLPDLIYVLLPEALDPIDRGEKYENPISFELSRQSLGEISGGGSQLGNEKPDGTSEIIFCGIDIDTYDVETTRKLLHRVLPELGCLSGTQVHYRSLNQPLLDEFDGVGWSLEKHREMLHPGFGI